MGGVLGGLMLGDPIRLSRVELERESSASRGRFHLSNENPPRGPPKFALGVLPEAVFLQPEPCFLGE